MKTSRDLPSTAHVVLEVHPSRRHKLQLRWLSFGSAALAGVVAWRILNGLVGLNTRVSVVATILLAASAVVYLAGAKGPTIRVFSDGRVWLRTSLNGTLNKTLPSGWGVKRLEASVVFLVDGWRRVSFKADHLDSPALARLLEYQPNDAEPLDSQVSSRTMHRPGGFLTRRLGSAARDSPVGEVRSSWRAAMLGTAVSGLLLALSVLSAWVATRSDYGWVLWPTSAAALLASLTRTWLASKPLIQAFPDGRVRVRRGLIVPRSRLLEPGWSVEESKGMLRFSERGARQTSIPIAALNVEGGEVAHLLETLQASSQQRPDTSGL